MTVKKFVELIKNDEGSGLVLALMTLMVFSILGVALGTITIGSYKLGDVNRDDNSAYYIAEAGANMAYDELQTIINDTYKNNSNETSFYEAAEYQLFNSESTNKIQGKTYSDGFFEPQFGEQPEATIAIEIMDNGDSKDYKIVSVGKIGQRTRTVEKNVKVTWIAKGNTGPGSAIPPITTTVAKNSILIENNVKISGTLHLDSSKSGSLIINDDVEAGLVNPDTGEVDNLKVYVHPDAVISDVLNTKNDKTYNIDVLNRDTPLDWDVYDQMIKDFPNYPTVANELPADGIIDTEGKNKVYIVDNLTSNISIKGDGRVDIYVNNGINLANSLSVNADGNAEQLQVFYKGIQTVTMGNSAIFNGTLFAKQANIDFGNTLTLTGLFITGGDEVSMGGGTLNTLFIAPYATVTYDNKSSKNSIKGIMVGNDIVLKNNLILEYDDYYLKNFPLHLPDPDSDGTGDGTGSGSGDGTGEESDGTGDGGGTSEGELIISDPGIEN
ncbi:pilus assembly PilX N-terminal domain-containing protein [Alkalibacterium putridalgicola]|uniref:pilus assembly PilX N-terminal domain-containing protein n=1 Tax=Alkalibacterium putridalgicola TaxID=426703 RepID=UPI0034CE1B4F